MEHYKLSHSSKYFYPEEPKEQVEKNDENTKGLEVQVAKNIWFIGVWLRSSGGQEYLLAFSIFLSAYGLSVYDFFCYYLPYICCIYYISYLYFFQLFWHGLVLYNIVLFNVLHVSILFV